MTTVIKTIPEWVATRNSLGTNTVGFVPTMGALHQGHLDLMIKAKAENDIVAVSIFVNPTQFNNKEDLAAYPVTFESDLEKLSSSGVDYLFYPQYEDLYPDQYRYKITEDSFSKTLCGQYRPGHFDGVLTVVMKLLNIIRANKAYFGEKDYQQYILIKDMVSSFFMETEIVGCPIVRDDNGLALSSRNIRLSEAGKKLATKFANLLKQKNVTAADIQSEGITVEYLEEVRNRRFAAVKIDGVRLIDNIELDR